MLFRHTDGVSGLIQRPLLSNKHPFFYFVGIWVYRAIRFLKWHLDGRRYSFLRLSERLSFNVKWHSSVLIRKLPESQMYLQYNKIKNLSIAIQKINGILIRPGEIFSFCRIVGLPTQRKGYLEGMEISRGVPRPGIGGGLCQISNLIYWLVIHSDLTIIERSHHGYDPFPDNNRVLPFGSGATVFYNYIDLQFKNCTSSTYQLNLWLTEKCLEGELRCDSEPEYAYSVFEKEHRFIEKDGLFFRQNEIWRKKMERKGGVLLSEEMVVKNFARVKYIPERVNCEQ